MTKISRKVLDEIGDQISGATLDAIKDIDRNLSRIDKLELRVAALEAQVAGSSDSEEPPAEEPPAESPGQE